jgi:DNA polymerase III subunit chi
MSTEVAFHTGVEDKLSHACRLLRKAYRQGARVVVSGPSPLLQQLDQALWTFEPQEFVPHVRLGPNKAPSEAQGRTPIWLVDAGARPPHQEVLVNLGAERRPDDASFKRIIEVVSRDADDVAAARRRWKQYEAQGWPITHHAQGPGA